MIKRVSAVLAALALILCLGAAPARAGGVMSAPVTSGHSHERVAIGLERILNLDVTAVISEAGVLTIRERIVFESAGLEIKRGLIRELPDYWTRPDGSRAKLSYDAITVTRDGAQEPWRSEGGSRNLKVYIGSGERLLEPGVHEYMLSYDVDGAVLRKDGVDSLYWNAVGSEWTFTVERSGFRLILPGSPPAEPEGQGGIDERVIDRFYYTGRPGERGEDAKTLPDGSMSAARALEPGEAFTVFYSWPTAITSNVEVAQFRGGLAYAFVPSWRDPHVFAPTLALLALYVFCFGRWRVGKSLRQTVIPLFEPPPGLSPGEARFALRGKYDYKAFGADMLRLVDKRYLFLSMVKDSDGKSLEVISPYPEPGNSASLAGITPEAPDSGEELPPGGQIFYDRLFSGHIDAVELDAAKPLAGSRMVGALRLGSGKSLTDTCAQLAALRRQEGRGLFRPARPVLLTGLFLWLFLMIAALAIFNGGEAAGGLIALLMLPLVPLVMLGLPLFMLIRRGAESRPGYYVFMSVYLASGVFMAYQARPLRLFGELAAGYFGIGSVWGSVAPAGTLLSVLMGVAFFALAWFVMPRRSAGGEKRHAQVQGLRMYLKTAEEHRFTALYPPEENVRHFEELLPYALALDVGETWADSFAAYCQKAGLSELARREAIHMDSCSSFSRSVGRSASRSATVGRGGSSRSSSGGRGGGSSGSGAGGGGGSGW